MKANKHYHNMEKNHKKTEKYFLKMQEDFKLQTLEMLKDVCNYIEDKTEFTIQTQMYVPDNSKEGYYRIYFSHNKNDWKYVEDIPNGLSLKDVYEHFKNKTSKMMYSIGCPPTTENIDNLSMMDFEEFLQKAIYSKEWILQN